MKIAYLYDSCRSMNKDDKTLDRPDCFYLPLHVIIDGVDYYDDDRTDREFLINQVKDAKNITTSQSSYGEVNDVLDEIIAQGYDVLVCSLIASGISGMQNLVYSCAINKKLTIVNLDSRGVGYMQVYAIKMFKEEVENGKSLLEIQAKVQHMLDVSNCYGIVDDLQYLKRGGRLSSTSALVGTFLKIKPIVMCSKEEGGKVINVDKARTRRKACEKLMEIAFADIDLDEYMIRIDGFDADEYAKEFKEVILEKYPDLVVDIGNLCFTVGSHTGPGTLTFYTIRK